MSTLQSNVSGRRSDVLQREADAIRKSGGKAEVEALDVSNAASVKRVADAVVARHGRLDIQPHLVMRSRRL